jgi:hypothetical protein
MAALLDGIVPVIVDKEEASATRRADQIIDHKSRVCFAWVFFGQDRCSSEVEAPAV